MGWVTVNPIPEGWQGHWGLKTLKLYVGVAPNLELVRDVVITQSGEPVLGGGLSVMFDSSHFPSGSNVAVKIVGTDSADTEYVAQGTAPVKNWAVLYGRHDLEGEFLAPNHSTTPMSWWNPDPSDDHFFRSFPSSEPRLISMQYAVTKNVSQGWTATQFATAAEACNVLHVHSHGSPERVWSDSNDYWINHPQDCDPPVCIYGGALPGNAETGAVSLLNIRMSANGQGLPPYNSTGSPPINIAYIDACNTGVNNSFADGALFPYGNTYVGTSGTPEGQAVFGHAIPVYSSEAEATNEHLWEALRLGYTAHEARINAFFGYQGANAPGTAYDFMHVWGDFYARLKSVYRPWFFYEEPEEFLVPPWYL